MPSTVKVRVKGARNLPPMDTRRPNLAAAANAVLSPSFHPSAFMGGGPPSLDAYVHVSLGGHSSNLIASTEEEELSGGVSSSTNAAGSYGGHGYHHRDSSNSGHHQHHHQHHRLDSTGGGSGGNSSESHNNTGNSAFGGNSHNTGGAGSSGGRSTHQKGYTAKTKVCRRSLNPTWDEEFRFDVTADSMLQDEPLIFRVCDWDAIQSDESIGLVYIDLNPLLSTQAIREDDDAHRGDGKTPLRLDAWKGGISTGVIDGWFPLYDTLGGVRGELGLSIKLTYIGDENIFRDSSAGVRLLPFSTLDPVAGYKVSHVFGFVEELVVASDPEFQWNDDFKRAKTSHETRQTLLYLLDSCVRRRMCKTVLDMGGNAVLGYYQNFDVEGDSGIVARTYGTCVLLERATDMMDGERPSFAIDNSERPEPTLDNRFSSRYFVSEAVAAVAANTVRHREASQDEEVQLLTMRYFDPNVRVRIGGLVTARSVKYLGNLASSLLDQETRDSWWNELRDEIRAHAKILCCSHVVGYLEASTINDGVAILSITGTAASVRGLPDLTAASQGIWTNQDTWNAGGQNRNSIDEANDGDDQNSDVMVDATRQSRRAPRTERVNRRMRRVTGGSRGSSKQVDGGSGKNDLSSNHQMPDFHGRDPDRKPPVTVLRARRAKPCSYCHVPYHHRIAPFSNMKLVPCLLCGKKWGKIFVCLSLSSSFVSRLDASHTIFP